jgi:2-dehydro-3-deoxygalactonokinase
MDTSNETPALVAVDWGTSSLRIWAMSRTGAVLAERRSDEGMSRLDRSEFEPVLRRHLTAIGNIPRNIPVIICGMAGARQGWREAPYVAIPATLDAICNQALTVPAAGLDVRILPGLCDLRPHQDEVMRGEETQLLGLLLDDPNHTGEVCLPGTHTKWVSLKDGQITKFSTTMAGELFAVLSQHSILQHTIAGASPSGDPHSPAFQTGFGCGYGGRLPLTTWLFRIRGSGLLHGMAAEAAADTLSGLLIGDEIAGLGYHHVTLIASGNLAALYEGALKMAGRYVRMIDASTAVQRGLLFAARRLWPQAFL